MARQQRRGSDLEAILKQAIERSGLSLAELARRSGVSHPQLSRFMRSARTLTLSSASKLFACLGLEVSDPKPEAAKPRGEVAPPGTPEPPRRPGKKK